MKRFLIFAVMAFALLMAMPGVAAEKVDSAAIAAADSIRQAELTSTIQDIVRQDMNHYDSNSESVEDILAMMIPLSAILYENDEAFIFIVQNHKLKKRKITKGPEYGKYVVVESGLSPDETFVASDVKDVREGMSVNTTFRRGFRNLPESIIIEQKNG